MNTSTLEKKRIKKMSFWEKKLFQEGYQFVAGVDEAGRGPLAGPVCAAACILPPFYYLSKINDSKLLTSQEREELFHLLTNHPKVIYHYALVSEKIIDQINILQATLLAMKQAVEGLSKKPDYLLIDGKQLPAIDILKEAIVEGDKKSISIAAASIIAKHIRDEYMKKRHLEYPDYGFDQHKGYATPKHRKILQEKGPCDLHRQTFEPIRSLRSFSKNSIQPNVGEIG